MPKKRASLHFIKPATPVHPSLSTSDSQASKAGSRFLHDSTGAGNSVNELLQRQRVSSAKPTIRLERPQTNISTIPPSWNTILRAPETTTPRPRADLHRRPAGPPPPTSWINGSLDVPIHTRDKGTRTCQPDTRNLSTSLKALPDLYIPHERSLMYQTLKSIAKNWDWHVLYDHHYLAALPVRYKEILVSLIAHYSPYGVRVSDLEILFLDDTGFENATGSDGVTHLDLSNSVGRGLNFKRLKDYFIKKPSNLTKPSPESTDSSVPDFWEDSSPFTILRQPEARFLSLTHLSLSRPGNPSWKQLLDLAPHLATLTHLSLAYWPTPSLTPNSKTAYRETPQGKVDYSATNYYSHSIDNDWSEAAGILKRLSKATYCLKWLDLTGCSGCISALQREDAANWTGAWRGLECIKVGQGWIPEYLQEFNTEWVHDWLDGISQKDESERRASWFALLNWAAYEENVEGLRRNMQRKRLADSSVTMGVARENIGRAGRSAQQSPTIWWDETSQAAPPSTRPEKDLHGSRVILDRGWDSWWIEDALQFLALYVWDRRNIAYPTRLDEFWLSRFGHENTIPVPPGVISQFLP